MIEFSGTLCEKCQKRINIKQTRCNMIVILIISLLFCIPVTIAVIKLNPIWAIAYLWFCLFVGVSAILPPKRQWEKICPSQIVINDDCLCATGKDFSKSREISQIRKIYDHGDYYEFVFKSFPCFIFLCQKDLIVNGTIEEFEERFADLIIHKVKR